MEFEILNQIGLMHTKFLDSFFIFITKLGDAGFIWILMSLILIFRKKTRQYGFMIAIVLLVNLIMGEGILKHLFNRPRPFEISNFNIVLENPPITSSFPSGHTASSFAVLGVYIFYIKKYILPVGVLSTLIAFSRLYLQVHYPSDILAGIMLGLLVSYFTIKFVSKKYVFFTLKEE